MVFLRGIFLYKKKKNFDWVFEWTRKIRVDGFTQTELLVGERVGGPLGVLLSLYVN